MEKRVKYLLQSVIAVCFCFLFSIQVQAQSRIEQVQGELPKVHAYLYTTDSLEQENIEVTLADNALELRLEKPEESRDRVQYLFLVDCSTSIRQDQMDAIRECIQSLASTLGAEERVTIISFGVTVETLCREEQNMENIVKAAEKLKPDQKGTRFFDALAIATEQVSQSKYGNDRKIAFVFSDSIDVNTGGYTQAEVDQLLLESSLPVYAFGLDHGTKENLDVFGAIARQSGGEISIVNRNTMTDQFQKKVEQIRNATLITLIADTNHPYPEKVLFRIKDAEGGWELKKYICLPYWKKDIEKPTITQVEQISGNTIRLWFSEEVEGAEQIGNYRIQDEMGNLSGVTLAEYEGASVLLQIGQTLPAGKLEITLRGITDRSKEKNEVLDKVLLQIMAQEEEVTTKEDLEEEEEAPAAAWFILTILIMSILMGITLSVIKKRGHNTSLRKSQQNEEIEYVEQEIIKDKKMKVHVKEAETPIIKIAVNVDGGDASVLEIPIHKSLFFGRSDLCDVVFDDPELSRQHFVIEVEESGFMITNISQTKETFLNGIVLNKKRPIYAGDKIHAGREELVFYGI